MSSASCSTRRPSRRSGRRDAPLHATSQRRRRAVPPAAAAPRPRHRPAFATPTPENPSSRSAPACDRQPMIRRLQALAIAVILLVAAFSTGLPFLFYLLYLAVLVVGGRYIGTR